METRSFHEVAYCLGLAEMPDRYVIEEEIAVFTNLHGKQLCPESLAIAEVQIAKQRFLAHAYAVSQTVKEVLEEKFAVSLCDGEFIFEERDAQNAPDNLAVDHLLRSASRKQTLAQFSRHEKTFLEALSDGSIPGEDLFQMTQSSKTLH